MEVESGPPSHECSCIAPVADDLLNLTIGRKITVVVAVSVMTAVRP